MYSNFFSAMIFISVLLGLMDFSDIENNSHSRIIYRNDNIARLVKT